MISDYRYSAFRGLIRGMLPFVLLLIGPLIARGAGNLPTIANQAANGTVGVAFTYQVIATAPPQFPIISYGTTVVVPGITFDTATGIFSGTPTTAGTYTGNISATNSKGTSTATMTITIVAPSFVGFRLPDFQVTTGSGSNVLKLQMGANGTAANRFNATLEVLVPGTTNWVPYNRFVGINDNTSWTTDAPLPVRNSNAIGAPQAFSSAQLTQAGVPPAVYMKADPRSTRFGVFQMDTNLTTRSRIVLSLWPSADGTVPNGFGGTVGTSFPGPVEHAPNRFGSAYYPATLAINPTPMPPPADPRYSLTPPNTITTYADNDGIIRPADAVYSGAATTTGASTPYNTASYKPIMLNRPFRNVAELGYTFRDLPWKTLDFFSDRSADAGLLDIFCIHDGSQVLDGNGNVVGMAQPTMVAGKVNLNTTQVADLQAVLAGSILDEINSTTVNPTGTGATDAPVLASQIVSATATTPMQNKSELITRVDPVNPSVKLVETILPPASNDNQAVKARREVVARTVSSVAQTRVWNLVIDVVAQSGHFKPNAGSLQNDFIVEGEQHYWVHVAIDRFTGRVIDKQIEVVNE